jgi:hypothetical protein
MRTAALALVLAFPAAALAADWEKRAEEEGISVYGREVEGSRVREVKAEAVVDAPPAVCARVVSDCDRYTDIMPYTKESKIVSRENDKVFYFYTVIDAPLVSLRDYTLRMNDAGEKEGVRKVTWAIANDKGPKEKDGVVRVTLNDGFWEFAPHEGGKKTRVVYYVHTDPGGSIPAWIANKANDSAVPNVLKSLRKAAKDARYQK